VIGRRIDLQNYGLAVAGIALIVAPRLTSIKMIGSLFMMASCASRLVFSVAAVLTTIAILPDNQEVIDRTAMRQEPGTGIPFPGPRQPPLRNFR